MVGTVNADGSGNWTYSDVPSTKTVASGIYGFSAMAMDQSANVSVPSPTLQLQVGGGPTATAPQFAAGVLSGQATAGSLVTVVDGNVVLGVVTADASGNWQFTPTLARGTHRLMAEATNSSGYTGVLSGALIITV
jgi:hypothetical protein